MNPYDHSLNFWRSDKEATERRLVLSTRETLRKIGKRVEKGDVSKNGTERLMVFVNDISDTFEDYTGKIVHPDGSVFYTDGSEWFTQPVLASKEREGRELTLDDVRAELFRTLEENPGLIFQVLTKRPENILRMVPPHWMENWPAHVWIGTSVDDEKTAYERIPHLLKAPAAVRFLSCEPLLGPVDLSQISADGPYGRKCFTPLRGTVWNDTSDFEYGFSKIHWVICGGESGHDARPMLPDWARSLRDQCVAAKVPYFFKQVGEWDAYEPSVAHLWQSPYSAHEIDGNSFPDWDAVPAPAGWGCDILSGTVYRRRGKAKTGRMLDGRTWDEFPELRREAAYV
jgi:protein gp37